ncbi:MAG: BON domain-containing protein [Acidobacteriia bacterium]|nr:BON domain-containing protein [Terriglobia bacterium]
MRNIKFLTLILVLGLAVPTAFARPDNSSARMTAELQDKIYHAKVFDSGRVQVAFDNGVATLTGTVDNLGAKLDAERAARKTKGVTQVIDNIRVSADDVTPEQILREARHEVVTYYHYTIFDNVVLELNGNTLVVSGQVTQPYKKHDLGNILARVRGVANLENNLEVLPTSFMDDQLRFQLARAIYGNPSILPQYRIQPYPPIHIIVKNGNVTLEGAVGSKMDKTLAGMIASRVGLSFSVTNNLRVAQS